MGPSGRRIALVCLTPQPDANELAPFALPSYGIRRLLAAVTADADLRQSEVRLFDNRRPHVDAYIEDLEAFEPDLIGLSVYVWSLPLLVEVAREIKKRLPGCVTVFGGPSARTAMFDLPPYQHPVKYADAIVPSDGEVTFCEIAKLPELTRDHLQDIGGLDLPVDSGWVSTGPRTPIRRLDDIASPFRLGLMPADSIGYLETYRGCPLSCAFCEWGANDSSSTVFSADYITKELECYASMQTPAVFLLDAGLNLNTKGFRNLYEAESRAGFLKSASLWCEVYPSHLTEEHVDFLSSVGSSWLGVGLQSLDANVLHDLSRPFNRERFESVVEQLSKLAEIEIQIIFGLPGDSPLGFRRTLDYARSLSVGVRVYHCLVLPDALMTRGLPDWNLEYDYETLEMIACRGWTKYDVRNTRAMVTKEAHASHGTTGEYWWHFPGKRSV